MMKSFESALRGGLYRSRDGMILGVCKGIADTFDFSVFGARIITLILLFFSGFCARFALIMPQGPMLLSGIHLLPYD